MKLLKPEFWAKKNSFISILLWPVSLVYQFFFYIVTFLTKEKKYKIPIICVGNIYLGGTGKTPLTLFLAKNFDKQGKQITAYAHQTQAKT